MSLLRSSGSIGALTLVSRVLGLIREMLAARYLGAGFASDSFLVAFRLPNLFRALFAEGAFSAAFVPMFNQHLPRPENSENAMRFAEIVLAFLIVVLLAMTIIMLVMAAPLVWVLTGGYNGVDLAKVDYTVSLTRLTIPYLALISLASVYTAVLNSVGKFWVGAAAPILLNACLITALLLWRNSTPLEVARAQAGAVTLSGCLQLAWLILSARRAGMHLRLVRPRINEPVKRLLKLILPTALGAGALQVNLVVSTLLAARLLPSGTVSHLYYADRLAQLPLGMVGIGIGTAILPLLSRQIARGDLQAASDSQNRAVELSLLFSLPAAAALTVSAFPLIVGLLANGAFSISDAHVTARTLTAFGFGIPAFVLIKVLTPGFHSRSDTRTATRIALIAMLVNLALNLTLIWSLQQVGLALSTSIAAWVNAGMLYLTLRRRGHFVADDRLWRTSLKVIAATVAMTVILALLNPTAESLVMRGFTGRISGIILLIGIGGGAYLVAVVLLRTVPSAELRKILRRRGD
ncbi:murein biosynthesis integral membrane protein MurJ [Xanthomonas arboricola]|uniref:murein biosynthesis integral membrane protein MurJ n=1 Tax=Xanthomonas arboricola TaxID=56448 RepID=UPI000CEE7113|nr:murein biosynthesis integral membrane protein MurJ [Xanthomonas arboricola]PPT26475.1 murein biosynthesis integral membrane protein MurJ [Xanthomonas arboricola]